MRVSCALSLAASLLLATRSSAFLHGHSIWARRSPDELQRLSEHSLPRREVAFNDQAAEEAQGDDIADDEESDYVSGVYEKMSAMLDQIQPSVDEIQTLSNNANDMNADEYADKISTHLINVYNAGDSVSNTLASEDASDSEVEKRDLEWNCKSCQKKKKKHHKHKHCHKCKKRKHKKCGELLKKWLQCCKTCVSAVLSCKSRAVKEKCQEHLPKITRCCAQVITSCGRYGISQAFRALAQVDISSFSQLGFGASAVTNA